MSSNRLPTALVGYTGFVGSTLRAQTKFDERFNSSNIADIRGRKYSLVVCAAAPAAKWKANQEPVADWANLEGLMGHLEKMETAEFILISTVDVYAHPVAVDEQTEIDPDKLAPYGRHRYLLEEFVRQQFAHHYVVRLPGLFGAGLRKNFLFDLIHRGDSAWTHWQSIFQFYNMAHLWSDLQQVRQHQLPLVNLATEPVQAAAVARQSFNMNFTFETENPPVAYDMQTRHAPLFGASPGQRYIVSAADTYAQIAEFGRREGEYRNRGEEG